METNNENNVCFSQSEKKKFHFHYSLDIKSKNQNHQLLLLNSNHFPIPFKPESFFAILFLLPVLQGIPSRAMHFGTNPSDVAIGN